MYLTASGWTQTATVTMATTPILGAIHLLCILLVLLVLMPVDVLGSKHMHARAGVQRTIFVHRIRHTVLIALMVVEVPHVMQHITYATAAALHIEA
jgi:hypothetical protein